MNKETYYFSHDFHSRTDLKILKLRREKGMAGLGLFWCIVEILHEQDGIISTTDIPEISYELHVDQKEFVEVLDNYGLFKTDGEHYWSDSANRRIESKKEKIDKARQNIKKRWSSGNSEQNENEKYDGNTNVIRTKYDGNTNVIRTYNDGNTLNERKGNEIKGKESVCEEENFPTDTPEEVKNLCINAKIPGDFITRLLIAGGNWNNNDILITVREFILKEGVIDSEKDLNKQQKLFSGYFNNVRAREKLPVQNNKTDIDSKIYEGLYGSCQIN